MSQHKNTLELSIRGMHCKSCEMMIEDRVGQVSGVCKVEVEHKTGTARIYYVTSHKPDSEAISQAVQAAGYSVGVTERSGGLIRMTPQDYRDLSGAALLLMGLYFIYKVFGWSGAFFAPSSASGVAMPLIIGLTASFSTCMALVGGLVLGISARHAEKHPEATPLQKFRPHIYFNLGRLASFVALGGMLGIVGSFFQLSSLILGILTIAIGLVMLLMGLQLIQIFPWAERIKLLLPKSLSRAFGLSRHQKEYSPKNSLALGALTFFLPCGFTQSMQLLAMSSGGFTSGAVIMGLFALGTAPGLLGVGGLTSVVKGSFARKFFKFAGLVVILFAFFNISNGFRLTGWGVPSVTSQVRGVAETKNIVLENGVQVARMTQSASGYSPNQFVVKKGIPVKWIITATDQYSCSSGISLPAMGIRRNLEAGENVFEFTPDKTGSLRFTCSMGMYPGAFTVIE